MLLEFRVQNFRALRDEQVLSLVAGASDGHLASTHLHETGLTAKGLTQAVRSTVIYGANASGKSTVLHALNYMRMVVAESATVIQPGQIYNVQPFRLDSQKEKEAISFELAFMLKGMRHEYAFAMRPERILRESLRVYRSAKPTPWFVREFDAETQTDRYEFSNALKGKKALWQESTRPNALFLSTAAQLNSEMLMPVFRWITQQIAMIPAGLMMDPSHTLNLLATPEGKAQVQTFLSRADFAISEVKTITRKGARQQVLVAASGQVQTNRIEGDIVQPQFVHNTQAGSATFELHEESDGTQHLFGLIGPLMQVLQKGQVLLVDELDSSLHALLVRQLVDLFHSPANAHGAQLVFTTHDTALLDNNIFRRDQIWFTEKDGAQAARLYPLSDFSPRNTEAFERNYLKGRYGGIPFLSGNLMEGL
jgi:uncharacterized protein